jgi:hypothetical protein
MQANVAAANAFKSRGPDSPGLLFHLFSEIDSDIRAATGAAVIKVRLKSDIVARSATESAAFVDICARRLLFGDRLRGHHGREVGGWKIIPELDCFRWGLGGSVCLLCDRGRSLLTQSPIHVHSGANADGGAALVIAIICRVGGAVII